MLHVIDGIGLYGITADINSWPKLAFSAARNRKHKIKKKTKNDTAEKKRSPNNSCGVTPSYIPETGQDGNIYHGRLIGTRMRSIK